MSGENEQETFNLQLVHALKDKQMIAAFKAILTTSQQKLTAQVAALIKSLNAVKAQLQAKDDQIPSLNAENEELQITVDNLEQYTRRASVRFYHISESTPGSTDDYKFWHCVTLTWNSNLLSDATKQRCLARLGTERQMGSCHQASIDHPQICESVRQVLYDAKPPKATQPPS